MEWTVRIAERMIMRDQRQRFSSRHTGLDNMNSSLVACLIATQQHNAAQEPLIIWIANQEKRFLKEAVKSAHLWKTSDRHTLSERGGSVNSSQICNRYPSLRSLQWSPQCLMLRKRALKSFSQAKTLLWNRIKLIVVRLLKTRATEKLRRASALTRWSIIGWLTIKTVFKAPSPRLILLSSKLRLHG